MASEIKLFVPKVRTEEAVSLGAVFEPGSAQMVLSQEGADAISPKVLEEFLDYDARLSWLREVFENTAPVLKGRGDRDNAKSDKLIPLFVPGFRSRSVARLKGVRWNKALHAYTSDGSGRLSDIAEFLMPRMANVEAIERQMKAIKSEAGRLGSQGNVEKGDVVFPEEGFELPLDFRAGEIRPRVPRRAMSSEDLKKYSGYSCVRSYRRWIERKLSDVLGFDVEVGDPEGFFLRLDKSAPRRLQKGVPLYVGRSSLKEASMLPGVFWSRIDRRYFAGRDAALEDVAPFLTLAARRSWEVEENQRVGLKMALKAQAMSEQST